MGQQTLVVAIRWIVEILTWIVIIDVILTFFPTIDRHNPFVRLIRSITEPMYRPVRKLNPTVRLGDVGFDLSPIIVILGIQLIGSVLIIMLSGA